jgi:serine phosphatase RsbU (regulator of sigma subunit)
MLIYQNGSFLELQGEKSHIGTGLDTTKNPLPSHRTELAPGARMYMFSDGFQDQFGGPQGRKFGFSRLKNLLASVQEMKVPDQRGPIQMAFDNWKNGLEQIDDTLLIGFEAG